MKTAQKTAGDEGVMEFHTKIVVLNDENYFILYVLYLARGEIIMSHDSMECTYVNHVMSTNKLEESSCIHIVRT